MDDRDRYTEHRELYRDPDNGKICGVCAGVAEYFGFEIWVVRVIAVSLLIFLNGGMILGYFIACWVLSVKPGSSKSYNRCSTKRRSRTAGHSTQQTRYKPNVQDVWKKGTSPSSTVQRVHKKLSAIEQRLQPMETFVTSDKFALHKEFESIQDDPAEKS